MCSTQTEQMHKVINIIMMAHYAIQTHVPSIESAFTHVSTTQNIYLSIYVYRNRNAELQIIWLYVLSSQTRQRQWQQESKTKQTNISRAQYADDKFDWNVTGAPVYNIDGTAHS